MIGWKKDCKTFHDNVFRWMENGDRIFENDFDVSCPIKGHFSNYWENLDFFLEKGKLRISLHQMKQPYPKNIKN